MLVSEKNISSWRLGFFALAIVAAQATLIYSLYQIQLAQGEVYVDRLRHQTTIAMRLSPARGAIVDRNNIALAENRSSFDVDFYLDELQRNYSRSHRGHLPYVSLPVKQNGQIVYRKQVDIVKIVDEAISPIAQSLGFNDRPNENELREHYRIHREIPFQFRTDVDFKTLARFSEHNFGVPGIEINARPVRHYNYGALAAHIIGYVGHPPDNNKSEYMAEDGYPYDIIGRSGIEGLMDAQLQGKPGGKLLRVNNRGYVDRDEKTQSPTLGNTVKLTLDARIQYIVEQAMKGVGRGAAIIMDPNTGDVLAMVSVPNYDPNEFVPHISAAEFKTLYSDPTTPLLNRAISSFPAGSVYKVLISLAALKSGAITANTIIDSPGVIEIGGRAFHDWTPNGQGPIKLRDALKMSCDTFFYQVGIKTGIDNIDALGELAGFGHLTGIALRPESPGILPGIEWLKIHHPKERWTTAYTANVSIGQGYVSVTPIQISLLMSAVANGGIIYRPRIIDKVTTPDGQVTIETPDRQVRSDLGVKLSDIASVREGLLAVVAEGTGKRAAIPGIKIAGKSSTAQAKRRVNGSIVVDNKTWFCGFAPFDTPRYVFCVMVEGGESGGSTCAPIAHDILSGIFAMEQGQDPKLSYVNPVRGHFGGVTPSASSEPAILPAIPVAAPVNDNDTELNSADTPTIMREDSSEDAHSNSVSPKKATAKKKNSD